MSAKIKKIFLSIRFTPPFTLFNATLAYLYFVCAAIVPNRRVAKGGMRPASSPLTQLHASLPTSGGLIFIDDIRFSTFACKLHTPCKGSRSFWAFSPFLNHLRNFSIDDISGMRHPRATASYTLCPLFVMLIACYLPDLGR